MQEELRYRIALTQIPQIGDVIAKKLITHFGQAAAVFNASVRELERIPEVGSIRARAIRQFRDFRSVDREMAFIEQFSIQPLCCTDPQYPQRLLHCYDSPVMLYYKGNADLNAARIINIVGTRRPSAYGRAICEQLVAELAPHQVMVVSGMAYGIDITAHRAAIAHNIPTIGVLAHGLDRIYPPAHKSVAARMTGNGGLLTDFTSGTAPDRQNFPKRNRIVAGMADATVVIESGPQGGSLITADIANSYNRDVFSFPGRVTDLHSAGCHELIKTHRAMLATCAEDILQAMGWLPAARSQPSPQKTLFPELSGEEQQIVTLFSETNTEKHINEICRQVQMPGSKVASLVLGLEMQHVLKSLPGQKYQLA